MSIYTGNNYRKIYEHHYGPIPKDENGRTYDIHHIDGDRKNNKPDNLVAVSLQEHYNIHYRQGDYGACFKLAGLMSIPPAELSELVGKESRRRVEEGTHNFLGGEIQRKANADRIANGTHNWLGGEYQRALAKKHVEDGTHAWLGGEMQRKLAIKRAEEGSHPFSKRENGTSFASDKVADGTHHLLKRPDGTSLSSERIQAGTHNFTVQWVCEHCGKEGRNQASYSRWHGNKCRMGK
jgi:hypothetical protein